MNGTNMQEFIDRIKVTDEMIIDQTPIADRFASRYNKKVNIVNRKKMCSIIRDTLRKEGYNYITEEYYLEEAREYFITISPVDSFVKECKKIYPKYVFKKLSLKFDDPLVFATEESKKWKKEYEKFCKKKN